MQLSESKPEKHKQNNWLMKILLRVQIFVEKKLNLVKIKKIFLILSLRL